MKETTFLAVPPKPSEPIRDIEEIFELLAEALRAELFDEDGNAIL